LAKINNEGKVRRSTKSEILGKAKVMSYEDLEKARAERAAKEAAKEVKRAQKEAKEAAKEAKIFASATLEAEENTAGRKKRGWKRKTTTSRADAPKPKAKVARISETQVTESEQEADASEPKAPVAWICERQVEEYEIAPEPWRAPVARMW
jgi:hypothetical protein